jgi:hypothetical protein
MNIIAFKSSLANTTDKWLLVGNGTQVIAAYETQDAAVQGMRLAVPSIADSPYGSVRVLAPGETWDWNGCSPRPFTAEEMADKNAQVAAFFGDKS